MSQEKKPRAINMKRFIDFLSSDVAAYYRTQALAPGFLESRQFRAFHSNIVSVLKHT